MLKNALIIVDVQNDFCTGGALEVKDGEEVVPVINSIAYKFNKVIATRDWHPKTHISFASNHKGNKELDTIKIGEIEQVLWPDHCVQGTKGAEFHKDLDLRPVDLILQKGVNPSLDSYSAFFENDKKTETGLHYFLNGFKIETVYLAGLATDYCVYFTAMDARKLNYHVKLILDATRGVNFPQDNVQKSLDEMKKNDIEIIFYQSVLKYKNFK